MSKKKKKFVNLKGEKKYFIKVEVGNDCLAKTTLN